MGIPSAGGSIGLPGSDSRGGPTGSNSSGGRDTATGDIGNRGTGGASGGGATSGGGDYSLETLPGSGQGGDGGQLGTMTASERSAVLDGRLRDGYEVFDGLILDERARTQTEVDQGRNSGSDGLDPSGSAGSGSGRGNMPQTLPGAGQSTSGSDLPGVVGASSSSPPAQQGETYAPPPDIPNGRDDDVIARQLREAAIREPDPELREALWDEYRKYTGISGQ